MSVLTRYSSWLSNAPWGVDRFRPRSLDETMASIFEFWNLLDAIMRQHSTIPWMYGYVRELQAWHMVQLVRSTDRVQCWSGNLFKITAVYTGVPSRANKFGTY